MALGLIGKKLGMTKVYTDKGEAIAVTVVDVGGNSIIQVKQASGRSAAGGGQGWSQPAPSLTPQTSPPS